MPQSRDEELESIRARYAEYGSTRAQLWDRSNRGFARIIAERDDALVALIRASAPKSTTPEILDVGSGAGDLAVRAHELKVPAKWTGVDLLKTEINRAKQRAPWGTWMIASADELPCEDDSFDVAVASTLFSSLPTVAMSRAVASEIARVLRPGGWLIWYDLRYDNPSNAAVHGIRHDQIRALFPGWLVELRPVTLLPPVARRLGLATGWLYPLLHALPYLRSHLVGRLQAPPTSLRNVGSG